MNKLVIALFVAVLCVLAVSAEKPKRLGCGKYCMVQVLKNKVAKEEFKTCVRTCISMSNETSTKDDATEMIDVVETFRSTFYEDIQIEEAELETVETTEEISSERSFPFERCVNAGDLIVRSDSGSATIERLQPPTKVTIWASKQMNGLEYVKIGYNRWVAAKFLGTNCAAPRPTPGGSRNFPMQKQCDGSWGRNLIGSKTICQVGCLMSSVSMALAGLGKTVNGRTSNPGVLNDFLKRNGGYQGNLFVWGAVSRFGLSYQGQPSSSSTIRNYVSSGNYIVILNVKGGGHWVLATGLTSSGYTVNDPGYNLNTYSNSQVVRAGVFKY